MRRILAAVDNSPLAYPIMNRAIELASATRSELTLLSVINENPLLTTSISEEQSKLKTLHEDLVYKNYPKENVKIENSPVQGLSYICGSPPNDLTIRSRIETGGPIEVICGYADQIDADVILVGNRGLGEIGALIGSTSERIVRKSSHTVMVVKSESHDNMDSEAFHKKHASKV